MAFNIFKKKELITPPMGAIAPPLPGTIPIKEVSSLKMSGLTNEQIINQLKANGYSFSQIRDALAQVETKESVMGPRPDMPSAMPTGIASPFETGPRIETVGAPTGGAPIMRAPKREDTVEEMERILEEIIREKWKEVQVELDRVTTWKNKMDNKITALESSMTELKNRIDAIFVQTSQKVEEYGHAMTDAKTEMQAMEKVMTKLIPALSDNIRELKDLVETGKRKKIVKDEE